MFDAKRLIAVPEEIQINVRFAAVPVRRFLEFGARKLPFIVRAKRSEAVRCNEWVGGATNLYEAITCSDLRARAVWNTRFHTAAPGGFNEILNVQAWQPRPALHGHGCCLERKGP